MYFFTINLTLCSWLNMELRSIINSNPKYIAHILVFAQCTITSILVYQRIITSVYYY